MKISTKTRYAIRLILQLSKSEDKNRPVTLRSIAEEQKISEIYLESIATKLRKNGYLESYKGYGGGYCLARSLEDITVGEIMRLMESTYFQVHCTDDAEEKCENLYECLIAQAFEQLKVQIDSVLNSVPISQLSNF